MRPLAYLTAERHRIARELDVEAALALAPRDVRGGFLSGRWRDVRETALAALHRLRLLHAQDFSDLERAESINWLFVEGWSVNLAPKASHE